MALTKQKLSQSDVSVEIDLEQLLGGAAKNSDVRETFFQLAFDKMLERLDAGKGVDGKALPKYSKAYKDSLEYAVYGKDGTVNMQLTGGMVQSVEILSQNSKKMKVGFVGDDENTKAYAHMTGYKGHPVLDGKVKPRNFFGWTDAELKSIARELRVDNAPNKTISDTVILKLLEKLTG
jgi:hypothetical protein